MKSAWNSDDRKTGDAFWRTKLYRKYERRVKVDNKLRVLVTGIRGQLGYDVVKELLRRGMEPVGVGREEMDITDTAAVERVITEADVRAVIHCAAYNAVDKAEEDVENCRKGNVDGARNIAFVCRKRDIKMLFVSTDYVFDGSGNRAWTTEDVPNPLSVYGKSKYDAELAVQELLTKLFVVRISWAFGINGNNFVKTMLRLSETRDRLSVVNDQVGSPTFTEDLAVLLVDMIQTEKYGVYHATNEGDCSWYEFACEIFRMAGKTMTVTPVTTEEYGAKAPRPQNSRLSKDKLTENGFKRLPHWQSALERYLTQLGEMKFSS